MYIMYFTWLLLGLTLLFGATALPPSKTTSNGKIYALSLNGTTNEANLLVADLDTYILRAGPPSLASARLGRGPL